MKLAIFAMLCVLGAVVGFWGIIAYVVLHFLLRFW